MAAAAESLQARLELVLDERLGPLTSDQRGFLQVAKTDGERLLKLIADFNEMARAEAGLLELDWGRFDLGDAVHQAIVPVWPRALALGKSIVVSAARPTSVVADAARLKEAVLRVVQQAVQTAAPGTGIEVEVGDAEVRVTYESEAPLPGDSMALAHASAIATAHGGALDVSAGDQIVEIALSFGVAEAAVVPIGVAA